MISAQLKLKDLAIAAGMADANMPKEEAARLFIQAIKEMKRTFDIPDTLPQVQKKDIPLLSRYADREANPLYPVPVLMDQKELEKFYLALIGSSEKLL